MLLVRDQGETLKKKGIGLYREKTKIQDRFKSSHHSCWFQNVTENSRRFWKVYIWLCHAAGLVFFCLFSVCFFLFAGSFKAFFFNALQLNVISAIAIRTSTKTNQLSIQRENENMKVKLHKMSQAFFPVISRGLESGNKRELWGKKQEKKEDFLVSFWSSPMLDFALLQVEHLHLCAQPIMYLIAVFFPYFSLFFKAREWVQVELALSQCFEFLWHASGKREDRRGTPGC